MHRSKSSGRLASLQNIIFERDPLGVIFLEPFLCGIHGREHLDVSTSPTCLLWLT
jgi:hypothetical protein